METANPAMKHSQVTGFQAAGVCLSSMEEAAPSFRSK